MVNDHPWRLVAPWYRWPRAGAPSSGRGTAPVFQKFSSGNFVNEFLRQPQHSLKFDPDVDQVYMVHFEPAELLAGKLKGLQASLYPADADGKPNPSRTKLTPTGIRKLFLDTHSRHYLVVCELHCDRPGFPSASKAEVCQMGFVVRRHYLAYPESRAPEVKALLRDIIAVQSQLAEIEETSPLRPRAARYRAAKIARLKETGEFESVRAEAVGKLQAAQTRLDQWKTINGVHTVIQGWVPGAHPRVGTWQLVENEPQELNEAWFPLYPLFADPTVADHDAQGRTIFFGVVPTASLDAEPGGNARFDDRSVYEIRCFVRRHKPERPRSLPAPDCCGPLTWSLPTERFQLAPPFDLEGTSNRPITIQMPNLAELAAQAIKRPFGKYSPVKVLQPQSLSPPKDVMSLGSKSIGGAQICFFSIPLITLVAMFVINIFLPIVVLIFNLWFLLAFKFCIPPSISIGAGLQADLKALPPSAGVDLEASVKVDIDGDGVAETDKDALQINTELRLGVNGEAGIEKMIEESNPILDGNVAGKLSTLSNEPLVGLASGFAELDALPDDLNANPLTKVDVTSSLQYEMRRTPEAGQ